MIKEQGELINSNSPIYLLDIEIGYGIKRAVKIIVNILKENKEVIDSLKKDKMFMKCIINSYMSARKISGIQNWNFQEITSDLQILFSQLESDNFKEKTQFLQQCIEAVQIY